MTLKGHILDLMKIIRLLSPLKKVDSNEVTTVIYKFRYGSDFVIGA